MRAKGSLTTLVLVVGVLAASPVLAQISDAPGTSPARDGGAGHPAAEIPRKEIPRRVATKPSEDAGPRDTLDLMKRARERAEGTPVPEPTPRGR